MPTYEYACKGCGEHLEVVQSFTDEALTECPACGGALRKVFGSIGISFKGSGFYKTDSRATSSSAAKPEKSEKADGTKSDAAAKSDTKSDTGSKSDGGSKSEPAKKSSDSKPSAPAASAAS